MKPLHYAWRPTPYTSKVGAVPCWGRRSYSALLVALFVSASVWPAAPSLPQLVRFYSLLQTQRKPGLLYVAGRGAASADGGKKSFTGTGPLSGYPAIQLTIKSDNAQELDACRDRVQAMREDHQPVDIRGMGTFTIKSEIDPPLDTGIFTLTKLDACGAAVPQTPASPSAAAPTAQEGVPAADLVAVPERYLDHLTVITGHLAAPVHFADPVTSLVMESEGQRLSGYFVTQSLPAESRLALVHSAPGSTLVLEGTLTRITPKSLAAQSGGAAPGYEFDVSKVLSIEPAR